MSTYIRCKRRNQTVFLYCEPTETVRHLVEKLGKIFEKPAEDIKLLFAGNELDGTKTAVDAKLENDSVVHFVFKQGDAWEKVESDLPKKE